MGCWFAPSLIEVEICVCPLLCEVELGGLDPSSVEVIVFVVGYGPYPSSVEVDCGCLAMGLPLGCEVVFERGVRYSRLYKSSSVEVPSVGDSGLEILHGGVGGDVELGA